MTADDFSIGEAAAMLGLTPHTIRAWERRHLVLSPSRTRANQRRYSLEEIELLRQVKHAVDVRGLSLKVAVREAHGLVSSQPRGYSGGTSAPIEIESADAWRAMADLMPESMLMVDERGRILDANIAFARVTGSLRGRLRGRSFVDFVDPYDRAKAVAAYRPPLQQRRRWELNLKTEMLTGLFTFDCWPIRAGDATLLGLVGHPINDSSDGNVWTTAVDSER